MKLPEFGFLEKCKIVGKTLLVQVCLFITLLLLAWGSQALYAKLDRTEFPTPVPVSYTHLDVYKRQAREGATRAMRTWT